MSVVVSLLRAIDRADGDALVMHVGEKPYVVTPNGHAELAANPLTVAAMTGMLEQLLPGESRAVLNELGAVEYHLPPDPTSPDARYSVVAARGGNDIWIEIRRGKIAVPAPVAGSHHAAVAVQDVPPRPEPKSGALPVETPESRDEPDKEFELSAPADDDFFAPALTDDDLDEPPVRLEDLPPTLDYGVARPRPAASEFQPPVNPTPSAAPPVGAAGAVVRKHADPLHHLLYVAAAHGASALYVAAQARPSLRVDGEIRVLDEAPLTQDQLDAGLRAMLQLTDTASLPTGDIETREVADVGRVQYLGFRDHRGVGAIFRMLPGRAISSEQSGLPASITVLCTEPEGLLLVAGARAAGKSTLVAALVDQINRTRRDHVITIEAELRHVHVNRTSFVSQREERDEAAFADAVRAALRETPDVLVIDGVMNAGIAAMALQGATEGCLVIASVTAPTSAAAIERFAALLGQHADEREAFADQLRGVVTQALLRKTGGGRTAAREVLVNVPSVAALVAGGRFDQIQTVLNTGRRVGMVPLNDALLALVQNGALDARQAYRKSPDQHELLEMLTRAGYDTTFAERLS